MSKKKIVITGATGKIGSALSILLAEKGASLTLCYRSNEKMAKVLASKTGAKTIKCDLSKPSGARKISKGKPDIIIHSAGTFPKGKWGSVNIKHFDKAIADNLRSVFFILQEMSKLSKRCTIIILTDACSKKFYRNYVPYCIAKSAIKNTVVGLKHLLPKNLKIMILAIYLSGRPKNMNSDVWVKLKHKNTPPPKIARKILRLLK